MTRRIRQNKQPGIARPVVFVLAALVAQPLIAQETAEKTPEATTEAAPASLPAISVDKVVKTPLRDRVFATGLVAAAEEVQVQPQIEGQAIDAIEVEVGDKVEQGQILARLSDAALTLQRTQALAALASADAAIAQAGAQLLEAQSAADEAIRVRDRTVSLRDQGSASQAAADQVVAAATSATARVTVARQGSAAAQAQKALAEAQIADIDLKLKRTQVTAPVSGEIVARNAQIGSIASAGAQPMFTIVRDNLLELRADVAEQDVLRLQSGQTASLRVVGLQDPLQGTVRLVEPTVDTVTRLGRVRIAIDAGATLRTGMYAEAEILVAEKTTLAVPVTAVSRTEGVPAILRVDGEGKVERIEVSTGIRDAGMVEVSGDINENDSIVSRAAAFVRPGDRINPIAAETGDAVN